MSKFGFDRKAAAWHGIMQNAMQQVANKTRDYFIVGFNTESWGSAKWQGVVRATPPPILNVTGKLKNSVQNSIVSVTSNRVEMIADPIDNRGRGYANYHNEGTPQMPRRSIMKQEERLTKLQLNILEQETGKVWQVR